MKAKFKRENIQYFRKIKDSVREADYAKGIGFTFAVVVPIAVTAAVGRTDIGTAMAVGVLLSSSSDVRGSLHRRVLGVLASIGLAVVGTLLGGYASLGFWFTLPLLALLFFAFSMISVYGFRASLVSFSGLLAIVLSLAKINVEGSLLLQTFYIALGGFWNLFLIFVLDYFRGKKVSEGILAEGFKLTADYLRIRAELVTGENERQEDLKKELFALQVSLNENHEVMRDLLISRRRRFGRSGMARKKLLVFNELVDILELSMANPVNPEKMQLLFQTRKAELESVKQWSLQMARHLQEISERLPKTPVFKEDHNLQEQRELVWQQFREFEATVKIPEEREALVTFSNLVDFKEKQHQKILSVNRLFRGWTGKGEFKIKRKDAEKFLTSNEYSFKILQNNFDLKSPIFRLSTRLTVVMVAGFLLGQWLHFQNEYWILLTSLVILRPGYALTKQRFKARLYGTLIGGAVAFLIVLTIQDKTVYAILAIVTLVLAFSMIQKNYKAAAAFITLNVVFIYSLLKPNAFEVIQYRVLDTAIGAGLAFLGNSLLWPTWEYRGIHNFIRESLAANFAFLEAIEASYAKRRALPTSYKLARKKAFLATGDLNAAFQRMAQEPKSKQKDLPRIFQIVSLNQEFLSSAASLGTFIRLHKTTPASEHFLNYIESIKGNLQSALSILENKNDDEASEEFGSEAAASYFRSMYNQLVELRKTEQPEISKEMRERFQEAQIVSEQLKWLLQISQNLRKLCDLKEEIKPSL